MTYDDSMDTDVLLIKENFNLCDTFWLFLS